MIDEFVSNLEHIPPAILKKALSGVLWEGTPESGSLALTFDDGPDPEVTPAVLDALDAIGAQGTFFLVGDCVREHPGLASEILTRGHTVGNHTMSHSRLFLVGKKEVDAEIRSAQESIFEATGVQPEWFRPPYGLFDLTCLHSAREMGLKMALWTVLAGDYSDDSTETIMKRIGTFIRAGSILVFHDTCDGGGELLPGIIKQVADIAQKQGIRLSSLDALSFLPEIEVCESDND